LLLDLRVRSAEAQDASGSAWRYWYRTSRLSYEVPLRGRHARAVLLRIGGQAGKRPERVTWGGVNGTSAIARTEVMPGNVRPWRRIGWAQARNFDDFRRIPGTTRGTTLRGMATDACLPGIA
jgi:hypothetical protein